jgi:metallo-beta-lactamase class B
VITLGDTAFGVYETPGHTFGTASYSFPVRDGARTHQAFTVGGLGLNAVESSRQVELYLASVARITQLVQRPTDPITVHLTTHPFSNGLTEAAAKLKTRKPGDAHPLVDPAGFLAQLETLRKGAEERLVIERNAGR